MRAYLVVSLFAMAGVGILLISYSQARIIKDKGLRTSLKYFSERSFVDIYWRDRTQTEKYCFLAGVLLSVLSFFALSSIALHGEIF